MFTEYLRRHDLHALLCAPGAYHPFPKRTDRARWTGIAREKREQLLAWGNEALAGYPMLTATRFLAFSRTGNRQVYEQPYFARRSLLMGAALAECAVDDGRYLDAVIDGIWCICEESSWVLSAHNGSDHPGAPPMAARPLPDVTNPYVDLFAAQTAATLADVLYLLQDRLDAVSPLIARRARREIDLRVVTPFLTHDDFWWMGMIRRDVNNWTPWIVSNVIDVLLLLERDAHRRSEGIARGMRMLDSYLAVLPPDGGCDEGAGYFNMAGAALADALQSVYAATGGRVSFYHEPLIRRIAAFPLHAHIDGPYFINFADCDAMPRMDGERLLHLGRRTDNPALAALGAQALARRNDVRPLDTPQMNRVLFTLFAAEPEQPALTRSPSYLALPDLQVFSWRHGGMYLAAKGGHNGESHNHNDVGTFLLYTDGQPRVIDLGNCVYTAKTFGPERYTLMNTRSRNHNVPLIGAMEQAAGREHAAADVSADCHGLRLDIAAAYPKEAGVCRLCRTFAIDGNGMTLTDDIELDRAQPVTWVFMLRDRPELSPGSASFGGLLLSHDSTLLQRVEEIPVTDSRMAGNFPGSVWRLALEAPAGRLHHRTFAFQRS